MMADSYFVDSRICYGNSQFLGTDTIAPMSSSLICSIPVVDFADLGTRLLDSLYLLNAKNNKTPIECVLLQIMALKLTF